MDAPSGRGRSAGAEGERSEGRRDDAAAHLEEGLRWLQSGCGYLARRYFQEVLRRRPGDAEARSHLAAAYLMEGDLTQARLEAEAVLAEEPDHVRACRTVLECHLRRGERVRARAAAERALRVFHRAARRGTAGKDDLVLLVESLARLGDDRRLHVLYRRYVRPTMDQWDGWTLARLGIAAFNVGRYQEARWLWRRAAREHVSDEVLAVFLHAVELVDSLRVPPFRIDYRFGFHDGVGQSPGAVKAFALYTLWNDLDETSQEAALDVLAQSEASWAEPFLFRFLCLPEMPDRLKLKAGSWLIERGFLSPDSPVAMHVDGELRQVLFAMEPPALPALRVLRGRREAAGAAENLESRRRKQGGARTCRSEWEAVLVSMTKGELLSLARALGVGGVSRLRKAALVAALADWLQANARAHGGRLSPEALRRWFNTSRRGR